MNKSHITPAQWNLLASSTVNNGQVLWGATTRSGKELASLGYGTIQDGKFYINAVGIEHYEINKK